MPPARARNLASPTSGGGLHGQVDTHDAHNFVVRFRSFLDGGSDKVPAVLVPTPGALALLVAATGLSSRRRRR